MKVSFRESFQKDLAKSCDGIVAKQVRKLIMKLERASALADIPNVKKLAGSTGFYRIRLGDYLIRKRTLKPVTLTNNGTFWWIWCAFV